MPSPNKEHDREYKRLHRLAFAKLHLTRERNWVRLNPEKKKTSDRRYHRTHPEVHRAANKKGSINNRSSCCGRSAAHRARRRQASLPGDQWEINQIYQHADNLRRKGLAVEVDHIYPCGFGWHEPANLQIIYASENQAKNANPDYIPSEVFVRD